MSEQDQIKAIAELDGWVQVLEPLHHIHGNEKRMGRKTGGDWILLPDYLHSYDAIIPVIAKCLSWPGFKNEFHCGYNYYKFTIAEVVCTPVPKLCEALLRATGKWKP